MKTWRVSLSVDAKNKLKMDYYIQYVLIEKSRVIIVLSSLASMYNIHMEGSLSQSLKKRSHVYAMNVTDSHVKYGI